MLINIQGFFWIIGRCILGLYFLLPGAMKIFYWDKHVELMLQHNMLFIPYLLALAALVEILLGGMLLFNYNIFFSATMLVGLVILINFNLHDFWNYTGIEGAHELQNFIKNIGIMGGLLVLASSKSYTT
jgi:putative oxidoreductase